MRSNPKSFIPILKEMLTRFEGKTLKRPDEDYDIRTKEGAPAV